MSEGGEASFRALQLFSSSFFFLRVSLRRVSSLTLTFLSTSGFSSKHIVCWGGGGGASGSKVTCCCCTWCWWCGAPTALVFLRKPVAGPVGPPRPPAPIDDLVKFLIVIGRSVLMTTSSPGTSPVSKYLSASATLSSFSSALSATFYHSDFFSP